MSWTLKATNNNGWKKWEDQNGVNRYQRPDGKFASRQQWSGSFGSGNVEVIPVEEETDDDDDDVRIDLPPVEEWRVIPETWDSYEKAEKHVRRVGRSIDEIDFYYLVDRMKQRHEDTPGFEVYIWGFHYTIITDDGYSITDNYRWAEGQPYGDSVVARAGALNILEELLALLDDYTDVVVHTAIIKMRDYKEL